LQLLHRFPLGVRAGKSWNIADQKTGVRVTLDNPWCPPPVESVMTVM
jgi:hypothetical protein